MENVTLLEVVSILEAKINEKMNQFGSFGRFARQQVSQNLPHEDIRATYIKMGEILNELLPVDYIIRQQNPHMTELFDAIMIIYNEELANRRLMALAKKPKEAK